MKTAQDMKVETEPLKKTQTEIKLEMKNLACQTRSSEVSLTNRLKDREEKLSGIKDEIEELGSLFF